MLEVASLVENDTMLDCLTEADKLSWQSLVNLFQAYSAEDRKKKFMSVSEAIVQDPIVKGKSKRVLKQAFLLELAFVWSRG